MESSSFRSQIDFVSFGNRLISCNHTVTPKNTSDHGHCCLCQDRVEAILYTALAIID